MKAADALAALGALAHAHRLAAYRLLVEAGHAGLPAGVIASRLKLPASSLTFHLKNLQAAGLATQQRLGRQLIYAADFTIMNELVGYLTENCCGRQGFSCESACAPAAASKRRRT